MKFLVLNDIHHGETRVSTSNPGVIRQHNSKSLQKLDKLVNNLSNQDFDLVIQLGDLVREIGEKEHDEELVREVLQPFNRLPFPTFHLLGNHDLNALGIEKLKEIFADEGHESSFSGVHQYENLQVVRLGLISNPEHGAELPPEDFGLFSEQLQKNKPTLVFSHYPVVPFSGKGSFYFDKPGAEKWMAYQNGSEILDFFQNYQVKAFISAHIHFTGFKSHRNQNLISLPAFVENIAAQEYSENNPAVYSVLEVKDSNLSLQSYSGQFAFFNIQL